MKQPGFTSPDTWETVRQPVSRILTLALQVPADEMIGLPDWTETTAIEIHAKLPPAAHEQLPQMLQAMFADRFQLVFHRATQTVKVRWIELAKGGFKLKPATSRCTDDPNVPHEFTCCATPHYVFCQLGLGGRFRPELDCANMPAPRCGDVVRGGDPSSPTPGNSLLFTGVGATMADLAAAMSANTSGPPWADHTGLTGRYDFEIHVDLGLPPGSDDSGPTAPPDMALATDQAFQQQAGLALHSNVTHEEPFPVVVIDRIAPPSGN